MLEKNHPVNVKINNFYKKAGESCSCRDCIVRSSDLKNQIPHDHDKDIVDASRKPVSHKKAVSDLDNVEDKAFIQIIHGWIIEARVKKTIPSIELESMHLIQLCKDNFEVFGTIQSDAKLNDLPPLKVLLKPPKI